MHYEIITICSVGSMTVDASACHLSSLVYCTLAEVGQTTLKYSLFAIYFISRGHQSIGYSPFVDWNSADIDVEWKECHPLAILLCRNRDIYFSSLVVVEQSVPLIDIEVSIITFTYHLAF